MKKISTFFLFTTICVSLNAQEGKQERVQSNIKLNSVDSNPNRQVVKKSSSNTTTTISIRAGESQVIHNSAYYQSEIDKIDAQIASINTKISYVNSNPEEKEIAINSGWFEDMSNIKSQLQSKKLELQSHLN